jgi:glucose/arabinose dehydrogenase
MRKWGIVGSVLIATSFPFAIPSSVGATGTAAPATAPQLSTVHLKVVPFATGLTSPVTLAWRTGDAARVYVAQQAGQVVIVSGGAVVSTALSLSGLSHGNEEGLLGITFSNDGTKLYVDYTDATGDIHIVEYTMNGSVANLTTRRQLMLISHHTFTNHNGGNLVMGADNLLYISVGDGGGAGDTLHNAQNLNAVLGKILRIDPRPTGTKPYGIPPGNPFVHGTRPAIWQYGLRNPWRFSLDRATHDLWIGDVGQNLWEEVDYAPAGQSGINWGWNLRDGLQPYNGGAKPPGARDPLYVRSHSAGDCAIIGGYVYRGSAIPFLNGGYVFSDERTGELRALVQQGGAMTQGPNFHLTIPEVTTFGQGPAGELYAASRGGTLYRLAPA